MNINLTMPALKGPVLESLLARLGVAGLVALSAKIGFEYWTGRGEHDLALLTLGAELVAFAGLALTLHHWKADWRRASGALIVTLMAAGWCGLTTWEKLASDTRAAFEQTAGYKAAAADLAVIAPALRTRLLATPPADKGPKGLAAWEAIQKGAVAALRASKADAERRMTPSIDAVAILRGFGVELAKLLGFVVFALAPTRAAAGENVVKFDASEWGRRLNSCRKDRQKDATAA